MPLRFALVIAFAAAVVPSELECGARRIALEQATTLLPDRPLLPSELFDALELQDCGDTPPAARARTRAPDVAKTEPCSDDFVLRVNAAADGSSDAMTFKTVARAVDAARALRPAERAVRIELAEGVHFLNQTLELDARDANTTIAGAPLDADGAPTSWLSGGELLVKDSLEWARATEMFGAGTPVWVATVPESVASNVSGLFTLAPHRRLTRARYPNGDAELTQWGYNSVDRMDYSLPLEGVAEWVKVRVPFFPERNFTARDAQCSFAMSIVVIRSGEARSFLFEQAPQGTPPTSEAYVELTDPANPTGAVKSDSTMDDYNRYANGYGGVCDLWEPTKMLGSYWCSNVSAGGWAEVDKLMATQGIRLLPVALKYNASHPRVADRLAGWGARAVGAVVHAWHPQSWFVNMYEVTAHDPDGGELTFGDDPTLPTGGWQGGRVWCTCGGAGACSYAGKGYCEVSARNIGTRSEIERRLRRITGSITQIRMGAPNHSRTARTTRPHRAPPTRGCSPATGTSRTCSTSSTPRASSSSTRRHARSTSGRMRRSARRRASTSSHPRSSRSRA